MKLNAALTTLASLSTFASALPNAKFQYKRSNDTGSGIGATNLNGPNGTTPSGGAGVAAQNTGLTTTTVVSTVTTTVSQAYTTFLSTSLTTATLVFPAGSAATAGSGSGTGAQPNSDSGSSAVPSVIAGSVGVDGQCACSVPTVVATGIYTATIVQAVDLGTASYTTTYATPTIGVLTIAGGQIIAAQPTISQTAVVAADPSAALSAGQSYETITVPASNGSPAYEIIVVVQTVTPVVVPVNPNGDGVGATGLTTSAGPYSNTTMTSTRLAITTASSDATSIAPGVGAGVGAAETATSGVTNAPAATTPATEAATTAALAPNTNAVQVGSLGTTPLYDQTAFIDDMLAIHNMYRARHGAPAMTWSSDLAETALANVNANAADGTFLHSKYISGLSDPYGENIGDEYGYNNPDYLVYVWYEEIASYNYSAPGYSDATGHFTQVVWDASTVLGCAFTQEANSQGTYLLACEYNQPGNVDGEYTTNVNPLLANEPAVVAPSGYAS